METKDIIYDLRTKSGLSQDELAKKVFVTRQAVSRWETGETMPNTQTLKLLSKLFSVSINTLLGEPFVSEEYCNWCSTPDTIDDYVKMGGKDQFEAFKRQLILEINDLLDIHELPHVKQLNILPGSYVNLEYQLPNGKTVTFLNDDETYLGSELEGEIVCVGIVANMNFIIICTYELDGANPELIIYKKR